MKSRTLVASLVAAGLIAGGAAAWHGQLEAPFGAANAAQSTAAPGVAAPAANPRSSSLPLNGFTDLVQQNGPAVVNITVEGTTKVAAGPQGDDDMPGMDP